MTEWSARRRDADVEWQALRLEAEQVVCPRCRAAVGGHCVNTITDTELRAPAHPERITLAAKEKRP